jgi:hypothetical protein
LVIQDTAIRSQEIKERKMKSWKRWPMDEVTIWQSQQDGLCSLSSTPQKWTLVEERWVQGHKSFIEVQLAAGFIGHSFSSLAATFKTQQINSLSLGSL